MYIKPNDSNLNVTNFVLISTHINKLKRLNLTLSLVTSRNLGRFGRFKVPLISRHVYHDRTITVFTDALVEKL